MENNKYHIDARPKSALKKLIPLLTVGFALYAVVLLMFFLVHRNGLLNLLESEQRQEMSKVGENVEAELENIIGDLLILHSSHELPVFVNSRDQKSYDNLVRECVAFLRVSHKYDMVRILDTLGVEILRVESRDGVVKVVAGKDLQDKSSRNYVQSGLALKEYEIFVSHLDLNIENGKLEIPVRPTLRFVKAITDDNKRLVGLLALNYKASRLIELLSQRSQSAPGDPLIVDGDGNWLLAENPEDEWSHILPNRGKSSFAISFPAEWAKISKESVTQILTDNGLFTSFNLDLANSKIHYYDLGRLIHPIDIPGDNTDGLVKSMADRRPKLLERQPDDNQLSLRFISKISSEEVAALVDQLNTKTILSVGALTLVLVGVMWALLRLQAIRWRAEALMVESEAKHRAIFNASLDPMINIDTHGVILSASATVKEIFGWNPEELIGKNVKVLMPDSYHGEHDSHFRRHERPETKNGLRRVRELEGKRRDGSVFPCEVSVTDLNIAGESQIQFIGVIRDITERRSNEAKLRENAELYRCLFVDATYACFSADEYGVITRINNQARRLLGFSEHELIGKKLSDFVVGDRCPLSEIELLTTNTNLQERVALSKEIEIELTCANGKNIYVSMTASAVFDEDGRLVTQIYSCIDITASRKTEAALRLKDAALLAERKRKQEYLHGIIDNAPNLIYARDSEGRFTLINSAFEKFVGVSRDDLLGRSLEELPFAEQSAFSITKHDLEILANQSHLTTPEEKRFDADGTERWLMTAKKLLHRDGSRAIEILSVSTDVTELSSAKTAAVAADKMAAIGTLASGVAHEFKNYLAAVIGNAEYLKELLNDAQVDDEMHEVVEDIIEAGDRANEVTAALLSYSRRRQEQIGVENLVGLVESTLLLVSKRALQSNIQIVTKFEEAPQVRVSAGKIQQLILNLLANAMDAIPEEGGAIALIVKEEAGFTTLRISDSGPGIPSEQLEKVFDPFFSTKGVWGKDQGSGTGLGLAICRNIAEEHNGSLAVESVVGMGTTFILRIPHVADEAPAMQERRSSDEFDTFVLFSRDSELIQTLSKQVSEIGARFETLESFDKLPVGSDYQRTLLICDGAFPSASELYDVCVAYRAGGASVTLLNKGVSRVFIDESSFDTVCNGCSILEDLLPAVQPTII